MDNKVSILLYSIQVEARLKEAREWAEEQQPGLSEAMKMSPPPELSQSFLFDHLSICSELEAKQLLLAQAMSDAGRVLAHLGLNERQRLQQLISDTQAEVESLSVKVGVLKKICLFNLCVYCIHAIIFLCK